MAYCWWVVGGPTMCASWDVQTIKTQQVSSTKKCHNRRPAQTNPWHREENNNNTETQTTAGIQFKSIKADNHLQLNMS